MALYYNLVFGLLVIEMTFFGVLSLPFPRNIRRKVLLTASAPFRSEQVQIAIRCIFGFVLVLFIDSVNRVYSVSAELHASAPQNAVGAVVNDRSEIQSRRFYAQRNMYLCGFTLFLTLILTRTYSLVTELVDTKDKLDDYKKNSELSGESTTDSVEVAKLKQEVALKDKQLELLKEQATNLSKDYDAASTTATKRT
ncbi:putative endoplasmic reticulum transmembrane protein [Clavispora lusitaniae]|uniref:Endoplasmic reticulum transmembrane protein n=3 Tax=Clavispora lusitaniae TaxID=36911 RepID=C4XW17_CLAL4|nr:uncharacterized protein CLUG_00140 [Clavispora lusitaniae ATCC 42720]KAF5213435.1 hypothetical protein E0198_000956 [Clavispora lusitaniae]EEQ36017.1 hypothetical protein CLUG_00140 [Clavispora lusitaniae ATCC 42720]KAF7584075.1 B-cell receptor-associated protein 31-like family protein [Clavispora lusitaniae]OVF06572.1 putative endoplasmic reticulum transmembrane protein [Clavispora lusitaniae]QFZ25072.1 putative endoplasmic reticulum transmembrane protein [Clavispora lusitaniae]